LLYRAARGRSFLYLRPGAMRLELSKYLNNSEFRKLRAALPEAKRHYRDRLTDDPGYGVAGNTFRAFRKVRKPSLIFRTWAKRVLESKRFRRALLDATTRSRFEKLHTLLAVSLDRHWSKAVKKPLSLAHRYKLVDLFLMSAARRDLGDDRRNRNLIRFAHVPMDSKVLSALDRLFSGILLAQGRTMGHMRTPEAYGFYQTLIIKFMRPLQEAPLYFDYFAWPRRKFGLKGRAGRRRKA
jgi:hypothetical protein